jgi:hypothetical protein
MDFIQDYKIDTANYCLKYNNCKCENSSILCFENNDIKNCINKNLILENLPLFEILINDNVERKYKLLDNHDSIVFFSLNDFNKILEYLVSFYSESAEYNLLDEKKCIIIVSLYSFIIKNYNIIKTLSVLYEDFIKLLIMKLIFKFLINENINKFNDLFNKYFIDPPSKCIEIMYKWVEMLYKIIN